MKYKPFYKYLIYSILSVALFFFISYLGSYNFLLKICVGAIAYCAIAYYFTNRNNWVVFIFIAPLIFIGLSLHVFQFEETMLSFPATLYLISSAVCGYFAKARHSAIPLALLVAAILAYPLLLEKYWMNKVNYNTFSQEAILPLSNVVLYNRNYKSISNDSLKNIALMDFWNSHCGPCYREFPIIDSLYDAARKNDILVFSVNVPMSGEKLGQNFTRLDKYGYKFPVLFATTPHIIDSFGVKGFPTTVVVANSNIVFRGSFSEAYKYALTFAKPQE